MTRPVPITQYECAPSGERAIIFLTKVSSGRTAREGHLYDGETLLNTGKKPDNQPPTYGELVQRLEEKNREVEVLNKAYDEFQARIQDVITNFPMGLIVVDKGNRIEAVNRRARSIFEFEPEELANQPIEFIFPETRELKRSSQAVRVDGRRKSGEFFAAEIVVNLLAHHGEEKFFVNVQDITERHRLEQLRRDLIAMVSHDIRGPLTAVRVILDMVADGVYGQLSPRGVNVIKNGHSSIDYLISLVINLLDADKAESGTIEITPTETTVGAIVNKAVITADGAKDRPTVTIETDITNDVIVADGDRVVQVLINLISNAIKYSPDNSTVRVVAGIDGLSAKFQVIDSGPGIPKEMQHLVFERYRQLEQQKSLKRKGFGLGLAICKALVEKHGGKIWVVSDPGKGSNFCFTIPLSPE